MASIQNRIVRAVSGLNIRLYRASSGRVMGKVRGIPLLLLTVAGRKTGAKHTVPVSYFEDDGRYVVTGSAGGTPAEPQWFRNLRQAEKATIEVGPKRMEVSVAVAGPDEHKILWEKLIAKAPFFAKYETKAGREIPMATLTRLPPAQPG
ncbi:MAG: nitroreductase family deazaflavin-dependent oxidoreductase [Geodermatophilaceae bacterium]|nr:nitroreductase family deazaflavin-dependent oxidoreductase [Geodermatophilaceae bacterium]